MVKNRRGMSAVIVTLLLVMLSIVLVGVVYVVVHNIVSNSTAQSQEQATCLSTTIGITSATCTRTGTQCNITVSRSAGSNPFDGIEAIISDSQGNSGVAYVNGTIDNLASRVLKVNMGSNPIANITEVKAAIYYNTTGTPHSCSSTEVTDQQVKLV